MSDYYKELSEQRKQEQADGGYPEWYSTGGYQMFKEKYLYDAKNFREQAERIANTAAKHLRDPKLVEEYSKRFFNMLWKGWLSPSTPVLANMGTNRGMPVSCSGTVVEDSISGFYKSLEENAVLTQEGFGTAVYLGDIRPRGSKISRGGKSSGVLPVLEDFVLMSQKVSQGGVRRGSIGQYIPLNHGDFWEIIKKLESDPDSLNIGWNIYDEDIRALNAGDEELHKRRKEVMRVKMITGKGYFFFPDKVNRHNPQCYKDQGLEVKTSQLCNEITLFADHEHTFTCVLSSLNLARYNEWKNTTTIQDAIVFLDCVASEFIEKGKKIPSLEKAIRFTEKGRALGLGVCGYHTYLQQESLPFESMEAFLFNHDFFKHMREEADKATKWLAEMYGEPEWCKGYGRRNTHTCVSGDTKVLTDKGQLPIKDLVGKNVNVWNGDTFSAVIPFETGINALYRVKLSNGLFLDCTADHKFLVATPKRDTKEVGGLKLIEVDTVNLRTGDCLPKFSSGVSCSGVDLPYAYTAGLFCGDGSISNSKAGAYPRNELRLYGKKMELSKYVEWKSSTTWGGDDCVRGYLPDDILPKYEVPFTFSKVSKQAWLAGLVDADGSAGSKGISISMKDFKFANDVTLLVQSLGGEPFVHEVLRKGGYDSTGGQIYYVVTISLHSLTKVFSCFQPKRVILNTSSDRSKVGKRHLVEVVSVEKLGVSEMTYCFTELQKGRGVFNGILTKQCAIAPTKSTALLMGGVSEGINPDPAMTFTQASAAGDIERVNPTLLQLMKDKGVYSKKNIQQVIDARGSVQNVDWLTDHEKDVFKTGFEINQYSHKRKVASRGKYIDQWQSWNSFFAAEEDPEYISQFHKDCWIDEEIRGMYYVYSKAGVTASKDCESCQ